MALLRKIFLDMVLLSPKRANVFSFFGDSRPEDVAQRANVPYPKGPPPVPEGTSEARAAPARRACNSSAANLGLLALMSFARPSQRAEEGLHGFMVLGLGFGV